mmetsp:Transcript_2597/g.4210  ORF Transcript_2597/g.4210 Transcript_2597/m.4210 type:complete len:107 (+) Transcript_2597:7-327(+)
MGLLIRWALWIRPSIQDKFLRALCAHEVLSCWEEELVKAAVKRGGLGIRCLTETAKHAYQMSVEGLYEDGGSGKAGHQGGGGGAQRSVEKDQAGGEGMVGEGGREH